MKKLRWGIMGAAAIAPNFLEGVRLSSCSVAAAVASRDLSRAKSFAARHDIPLVFGSYDEMLRSGAIDAVYIPLPNSFHAEWMIRSLEAGIPALSEKPFTATAAEAREVLKARERTGLPVAEGFMYRFHPMQDRLMECLKSGAIGEPVLMHSTFRFILDDPTSIVVSAELAGGALLDVGCYCVNMSRRVAGCEPVRAMAFKRGTAVDDSIAGVLQFPNGFVAQMDSSIESHGHARAEIAGTKGSIVLNAPFNPGGERGEFIIRREGAPDEKVVTPGANRFHLEVEDFASAVLHGTPLRWPIEDAIANMAALDALIASARTGEAARVEA
ncbi:MAG TPA: Gfo/Idh/MocA family oxidoreductase [Candidatus Brocadiia bacterium]|nr:Gfo/Idh/MocA family oxidoreductase [Candidatus Brocadiia bacterium]